MIELVPFEVEHFALIELQAVQRGSLDRVDQETREEVKRRSPDAWTFMSDDKPMICSGIMEQREGLALAWSYFSHDAGKHLLAIHRIARRVLRRQPFQRIEAHVVRGHAEGSRWLEMLGFELETPNGMKCFTPSGHDVDLWALVRRPVRRPRMALPRLSGARALIAEV